MSKALVVFWGMTAFAQATWASLLPMSVQPGQVSAPLQAGSVTGGAAGRELSILKIKEEKSGSEGTQLVIEYGDHGGQPARGEPGYFHISIDRSAKRITLDLAQVTRTAIDQKDLTRALQRSSIIAASDITMDPQDSSTNITLNLRRPVNMKVKSERGNQARLVLQLEPLGEVRR